MDITADLGIPAYVAINYRKSGPTQDIIMGFGAHPDARIAINRAITEMNQFIPAILNNDPESRTNYQFGDQAAIQWWETATLDSENYLVPLPNEEVHLNTEQVHISITDQLQKCIHAIESQGLEVLFLNQTRPDIELPVIKAIVPGMRHFWSRLAPGRRMRYPLSWGGSNTLNGGGNESNCYVSLTYESSKCFITSI